MKVREPIEVIGTGKIPGRSVRARAFRAVAVVMHGAENLPRSVEDNLATFLGKCSAAEIQTLRKKTNRHPIRMPRPVSSCARVLARAPMINRFGRVNAVANPATAIQ